MVETKKSSVQPPVSPDGNSGPAPSGQNRQLPPLDDGIGVRIRQARERRGWIQNVLSTRTKMIDPDGKGVSRTVIIGYETGTHKPGARELRLLCEALQVSPNWILFGRENPFEVAQPSMATLRGGNELLTAIRLAFSILLLRPHERDTVSSLVLSLGGREVGDLRFAGLSMAATWATEKAMEELEGHVEGGREAAQRLTIRELIDIASRSVESSWGTNLRFNEDTEEWEGSWLYKDPEVPQKP